MRYPSEIWVSDCSQLGENLANNDNVIICRQYLVDNYFCPCCISLNKFRTWFKLHVMSMSLLVPKLSKKLPRLKFVQYLGTAVSKSYQSWHGCF